MGRHDRPAHPDVPPSHRGRAGSGAELPHQAAGQPEVSREQPYLSRVLNPKL